MFHKIARMAAMIVASIALAMGGAATHSGSALAQAQSGVQSSHPQVLDPENGDDDGGGDEDDSLLGPGNGDEGGPFTEPITSPLPGGPAMPESGDNGDDEGGDSGNWWGDDAEDIP
jgi:hypothetical protein